MAVLPSSPLSRAYNSFDLGSVRLHVDQLTNDTPVKHRILFKPIQFHLQKLFAAIDTMIRNDSVDKEAVDKALVQYIKNNYFAADRNREIKVAGKADPLVDEIIAIITDFNVNFLEQQPWFAQKFKKVKTELLEAVGLRKTWHPENQSTAVRPGLRLNKALYPKDMRQDEKIDIKRFFYNFLSEIIEDDFISVMSLEDIRNLESYSVKIQVDGDCRLQCNIELNFAEQEQVTVNSTQNLKELESRIVEEFDLLCTTHFNKSIIGNLIEFAGKNPLLEFRVRCSDEPNLNPDKLRHDINGLPQDYFQDKKKPFGDFPFSNFWNSN